MSNARRVYCYPEEASKSEDIFRRVRSVKRQAIENYDVESSGRFSRYEYISSGPAGAEAMPLSVTEVGERHVC